MRHEADHDPITDARLRSRCDVCSAAFSATIAHFHEQAPGFGPHNAAEMIRRMREINAGNMRVLEDSHIRVMVGPYDHERRGDFDG